MRDYPLPTNDESRVRAVHELDLMRRREDPFFAAAVAQARAIFAAPIAFISLFDSETQTFLAQENVPFEGPPRDKSLCSYTVAAKRTIVLPDTHVDPRSRDHPIVTSPPHVRFSASAPVVLSSGFCIGTICAIDLVPRDMPTDGQVAQLEALATMVGRFYEVPLEPDAAHAERLREIAVDAQAQFLSLIGHELRTPLNGIQGIAQILEPGDPDQEELIEVLAASADRLADIVENVIAFSELASGDMALDEEVIDIAEAVSALIDEFRPIARMRGRTIEAGAISPCPVRADGAKIGLALACLLANVNAHGARSGVIDVEPGPEGALIRVRDDGPGIAPEIESRIWNAFSVGGAALTRDADGIGLGLPLTRRLIELHGGEIRLDPGTVGTCATIRLPAWRNESMSAAA